MKLTETQLRRLVREELMNVKPLMTEARANEITQQMLEEGLWDSFVATVKGAGAAAGTVASKGAGAATGAAKAIGGAVKKGAGAAGEAVTQAASAVLQPLAQAAKSAHDAGVKAKNDIATAFNNVKDEAQKAAIKASADSLKNSLTTTLGKDLPKVLKALIDSGMDEKIAKSAIYGIVQLAMTGAVK